MLRKPTLLLAGRVISDSALAVYQARGEALSVHFLTQVLAGTRLTVGRTKAERRREDSDWDLSPQTVFITTEPPAFSEERGSPGLQEGAQVLGSWFCC